MSKPTLGSRLAAFMIFVGLMGVALWVCLHPEIILLIFILASALGLVLAGLAGVCSPAPRRAPPPATPPPARQSDTLTPLLAGLALGWWLGGDPGDGSSSD